MSIELIITVAEADTYLADNAVWLALSEDIKESHIFNASLYIQVAWVCVDIDWTDQANIPDEIKKACSLYALADMSGLLFGDVTAENERLTSREMVKVGTVTVDEMYVSNAIKEKGYLRSFGLPDALMSVYCRESVGGSVSLTRV